MSIHIGKKEITAINVGRKAIAYVYEGLKLVWQAVRSCYGRGYWINDKPWLNDDGWKNT